MSSGAAELGRGPVRGAAGARISTEVKEYFFSDARRTTQTVLGLIWLLDGGLQFQSFMYGNGFIQMLKAGAAGQPGWLASSVNWGANLMHSDQVLFNTLAALVQLAIGFGLLNRSSVKPALLLSFGWALVVWWFGEACGMLFMNMAQPLTGAPGGVLLYLLIGLIVWPSDRPGGLVGVRGARMIWGGLWMVMAWAWLLQPSSSANAIRTMIQAAPAGMGWLGSLQHTFMNITQGNGLIFALIFAALSAAIGIAVYLNWRAKEFLILAAVINILYWVIGQGFGGIFAGGATDPNAGPLFVLLAYALYWLIPYTSNDEVAHA
jgi:hypothetical protein